MTQHGISREDIAVILEDPERQDSDAWVERLFRNVRGREVGVVVTRRLGTFLLVVTVFLVDEE